MQTIIGAFDERETAQRAVERLVQAGFAREDVHVEQGEPQGGTMQDSASTGAGTQDRFQGMESEVAVDRGVLSSIGHFFTSLFGQDHPSGHAGTYSEAVRRGTSVVVVDAHDDQQADEAATLLHELGAIDIDERASQWRAGGWSGAEEQPRTASSLQPTASKSDKVLDVVQEELNVGKREVERGGVRVVQRVSQQPVREIVKLREEQAVVERRPVDRVATTEDLSNFREGTIEVRETAEEAVVGKTARVVEEVRVGKQVHEREETIDEMLRRKDVDIERIGGEKDRSVEDERAFAAGKPRSGDDRPR